MEGQFSWKVVRSIRHQIESPARRARTRENVVAVGLRDVEQPTELDELLLLNRPAALGRATTARRHSIEADGGRLCAERDEKRGRGREIRIWPCLRFLADITPSLQRRHTLQCSQCTIGQYLGKHITRLLAHLPKSARTQTLIVAILTVFARLTPSRKY